MRKIYKSLTADQKARGICFSSTLSRHTTELATDTMHEVHKDDPDKWATIDRLKDDKFFNGNTCGWKYNIIRGNGCWNPSWDN